MDLVEITLPGTEVERLRDLSQRTGKSEGELLREALDLLSARWMGQDRLDRLRRAKGIWKDRDDLAVVTREINRVEP